MSYLKSFGQWIIKYVVYGALIHLAGWLISQAILSFRRKMKNKKND